MTIWRLLVREILHRKLNFALGVFSVMVASGSLIGALMLLRIHDLRTVGILKSKEDEVKKITAQGEDEARKAMLKLGFNIAIFPAGQELTDWYSKGYATEYMPEDYVEKLANSGIVTVRHFLPSLQQWIEWPERKRNIILVGTRGEVPNLHKSLVKPLVQSVPPGTITLGYELHRSMDIKVGDTIELMGKSFEVNNCYNERGNRDDITAWIYLAEAQELLDKKDKINAILALECHCAGDALPRIREEIASILPNTQVKEQGTNVIARREAREAAAKQALLALEKEKNARAELRQSRERFASVLIPVIVTACAVWVAVLGFTNVRTRRDEIGILRTLGVSARDILMMFMSRHILLGVLGGALGFGAGVLAGGYFNAASEGTKVQIIGADFSLAGLLLASIGGAAALAVIAGWIPALMATRQDPAVVLREE